MATSARKHTVPAPLETPRRQAINDGFASVNDIVPVANVTERAQLLADLGWTPSAGRPLVIFRADAQGGAEFEWTKDGTTWRAIATEASANITTFGTGWTATAGAGHVPRVRRVGNQVFLYGSVTIGAGGSMNDICAIPAGFTPTDANTVFIGSTSINPNGGTAGSRELVIANGRISAPAGYGSGSPAIGGNIPLGGCSWAIV